MEEGKKISFGFSKLSKKTIILPSKLNETKPDKKEVELIDCFEGNSLKLKHPTQTENKILVIPMKTHSVPQKGVPHSCDFNKSSETALPLLKTDDLSNSSSCLSENTKKLSSLTQEPAPSSKPMTIDEIAVTEILNELNKNQTKEETRVFSVPLTNNPPAGEKESTQEDYDNIPVSDFGLAMLRGMGWAPGKGIGKNEKLVTPALPILRPKGMGLGADKVIKKPVEKKIIGEDLQMVKGSFVRVVAGSNKDLYGQIEGLDDETGRLFVKLALRNITVSLNEFMVQLVDKSEFTKNSKVINAAKYEKFKDDEKKNDLRQLEFCKVKKESHPVFNINPERSVPKLRDEPSKYNSSSSESEFSHRVKDQFSPAPPRETNSREKAHRQRSSSTSCSEGSKSPNTRSKSPSIKTISHSRNKEKSSSKDKSTRSRRRYKSSSQSKSSSEDSGNTRRRTKKKKPSSHRHYSRSPSRSPKKHKKHRKSKY